MDALVLAVRHKQYLDLDPEKMVAAAGQPFAVVDCFGILDDERIHRYFDLGCEVKGLGRGHIQRIKDQVRKEKRGVEGALNVERDRAFGGERVLIFVSRCAIRVSTSRSPNSPPVFQIVRTQALREKR